MRDNPGCYMSLLPTSREKETQLVITNSIDHEECRSETLNLTVGFAGVCFSSASLLRARLQVEAWSHGSPGSRPTESSTFEHGLRAGKNLFPGHIDLSLETQTCEDLRVKVQSFHFVFRVQQSYWAINE